MTAGGGSVAERSHQPFVFYGKGRGGKLVAQEVMPPDTNRGPAVAGGWVCFGGRKAAVTSCRNEVVAALSTLRDRTGQQVFTPREVYATMLAAGAPYAESTVFKTMQRMKAPAGRPPWIVLEQTGAGFRIVSPE